MYPAPFLVDGSSHSLGLRQIDKANHLTMLMYEAPAKQIAAYVLEILNKLDKQVLEIDQEIDDE